MTTDDPAIDALSPKLGKQQIRSLCFQYLLRSDLSELLSQFSSMANSGLPQDALYGAAVVLGYSEQAPLYAEASLTLAERILLDGYEPVTSKPIRIPRSVPPQAARLLRQAAADLSATCSVELPCSPVTEEQKAVTLAAHALFRLASARTYQPQTRAQATTLLDRCFGNCGTVPPKYV